MSRPRHVFGPGGTGYLGSRWSYLVRAVETPASGVRIVEAAEIRKARLEA